MQLKLSLVKRIGERLIQRALMKPPDYIVGGSADPYLLRWFLLGGKMKWDAQEQKWRWGSRSIFGMRLHLHCFLRSDDDRALHDHPAASVSIGLRGNCTEHTIIGGGIHFRRRLGPSEIRVRRATFAHRIEIDPGTEYWTLFLFFRDTREWGFHCPNGWVPWWQFVDPTDAGKVGRGCGEGQ